WAILPACRISIRHQAPKAPFVFDDSAVEHGPPAEAGQAGKHRPDDAGQNHRIPQKKPKNGLIYPVPQTRPTKTPIPNQKKVPSTMLTRRSFVAGACASMAMSPSALPATAPNRPNIVFV